MRFNFFTTRRVSRTGQYDGIHHFVAFNLSGEKRRLVQFLGGEFHSSAICQRFNPLVAHAAPPKWRSIEIIRLESARWINLLCAAPSRLLTISRVGRTTSAD